jgi:hypothetical protein
MKMSTAQIGAAGVLLIQYRLLKCEIESAPMTTDAGIDLVVYAPRMKRALTVQVKTNRTPKPGGGKGLLALDWYLRCDSPAEIVGLVDLSTDRAWLMTHDEFEKIAQQKTDRSLHLYFYIDSSYRGPERSTARAFDRFLIEHRMADLFGHVESPV